MRGHGVLIAICLVGCIEADYYVYPDVFNDPSRDRFVPGKFPANFKFGAASASYQVEGAWSVDGKGLSIWDVYCHVPGNTHNNETGDDACKSFYKWDDDVRMLQNINADFYRFSISWPRILPNGILDQDGNGVDMLGIKFYNDSINALIAAGIEPMVTMFHWDLPQALQEKGGQTNPELANWFSQYAEVCFQAFGDRVKHWMTFNEPQTVADCYESGLCAPGILNPGIGSYQVVHQQLLAHQAAWHIYDSKYRAQQQGKVGIAIAAQWFQPQNSQQKNIDAANKGLQFNIGWLLSPLLKTGNYPDVMQWTIGNVSAAQGFAKSRLPVFTPEEQKLLLGAVDFVGLNYYTARIAKHTFQVTANPPSFYTDMSIIEHSPRDWPRAASAWLVVAPFGIRYLLGWAAAEYGANVTEWMITENGFSSAVEEIPCENTVDIPRTQYLVSHLDQMLRAIQEDEVKVTRYTHWALMDNFEWIDGYSKKFGIYCTNFKDPDRWRTPRYSADVYSEIIRNHGFAEGDAQRYLNSV